MLSHGHNGNKTTTSDHSEDAQTGQFAHYFPAMFYYIFISEHFQKNAQRKVEYLPCVFYIQ